MKNKTQLLLDGAKGLRSLAEALEIAAEMLESRGFETIISEKDMPSDLLDQQTDTTEEKPEEIPLTLTDVRMIFLNVIDFILVNPNPSL